MPAQRTHQEIDADPESKLWREAMKTILSALLALSVIAAVAAPASAADFNSKSFWQEQGSRY